MAADPGGQLDLLLARVRRATRADRVAVWVPMEGSDATEVLADAGVLTTWATPETPHRCLLPGPHHPTSPRLRTALTPECRMSPLEASFQRHGFPDYAAAPLVVGTIRVGTLFAWGRTPGELDASAPDRLREAAPAIAAIVQYRMLLRRHHQHARTLEWTHRLLIELRSAPGLRAGSHLVAHRLQAFLEAERVAIYLEAESRAWVSCEGMATGSAEDAAGKHLLPGFDPRVSTALGGPCSIPVPEAANLLPEAVTRGLGLGTPGSLLVLPLTAGAETVGVVLAGRAGLEPPAGLLSTWSNLGDQLGRELHIRRQSELNRTRIELQGPLLSLESLAASRDPREIPAAVARQARNLVGADDAVVFLMEPDGETLRPAACLGPHADAVLRIRVRRGEGITGTVAATGLTEVVNEAHRDPRAVTVAGAEREVEAVLAVPLRSPEGLLGVLTLHRLDGTSFSRLDRERVELLAGPAGALLAIARATTRVGQEREVLGQFLDRLPAGILMAGAGGRIELTNAAGRRLIADAPEARTLEQALEGPGLTPVRNALDRLRSGATSSQILEVTLDSRAFLVAVNRIPEPESTAIICLDITARKENEAHTLQSSKMSAVGQLAAGVAHEFNNLIAGIYGYAQFMKEHPDPKVVGKGVEVILESSERARELTTSLLTFSRRRPGRREPVDVSQVLADTLLLFQRQLERGGIRIVQELESLPVTVADAAQLQQVFLELIVNAEQAMSTGGTLTVRSALLKDRMEIRIRDTGPGIPPEILPRIFEPFFTTKGPLGGARMPGTGLGLSTAYNAIRDHSGTLTVESEPGSGTEFRLTLPVRALHEPSPREAPARTPDGAEHPGRILVVDEDADLRELVREILEELGHEVDLLGDARAVPGHLEARAFDMLIVDRLAPGMEDMAIYRMLRESRPRLPVLFMTNRRAQVDAEGDPWMFRLNKPFRNRDLVVLVSRILSQRLDHAS